MTGVSMRELIKYPKNPKGLCIPSTAISKQNTTYMKRNIIAPMLHLDAPNVMERSAFNAQCSAFDVRRFAPRIVLVLVLVLGIYLVHRLEGRSTLGVHRSPFTVHRSPFTVHRSPFTVHRSPFTVHRSPFTVHRSPFTVHRSR